MQNLILFFKNTNKHKILELLDIITNLVFF